MTEIAALRSLSILASLAQLVLALLASAFF
jgi:hypothetical protein